LHFSLPVVSAKFIANGILPPSPRLLSMDISYSNVPVLSSVCEKCCWSTDDHVIQRAVIFNKHIYVLQPEFMVIWKLS
jgi:hypothetical protein